MKTKKKPETSLHLELDGKIFITEKQGKKIISREEIDGNIVLQGLVSMLDEGTRLMETNQKFRKGVIKFAKGK